jgi:aspartate/methionine/tyrosine aminotransferase
MSPDTTPRAQLEVFAMERLQSVWENRVEWNVSESGVHPLRVEELVDDPAALAALMSQPLGYPQTNGTVELRSAIAAMYPGATPDHVEVTNGGSEANLLALMHLVGPGDDVVMMTPNYMQVGAVARWLGATVKAWPLVFDSGLDRWRTDLESLSALVGNRTKAILICNPNNPTGARFPAAEIDEICHIAGRAGAWVLSDEIYRGAELDGVETATVWGRAERALVTSGLSKAYGLPGLRIGWVTGPSAIVEALWGIHDYTSIAPGAINDRLARIALAPARREQLLVRTRSILRANYPILRDWVATRTPLLSHVAPEAGAIAFVRYHHAINSTRLIERLRDEHSVLVVPGDHFDMDGYLRIGFGSDPAHLSSSLERIGALLDTIPAAADAR